MLGTKTKNSAKQAPISSHPFFAAVVALWFAALLGLGSLVVPVALFETIVTSTGISSIIASAQPPLGATARIAIAVFAAIAGAIAGLLIARKVSAAQVKAAPGRNVFGRAEAADEADAAQKKPISAHEELGAGSLDEAITDAELSDHEPSEKTYSGKRRSLAVTDDSGPSDYFDQAPLPGEAAAVVELPELTDEAPEDHRDETEEVDEINPMEASEAPLEVPLELADLATEEQVDIISDHELNDEPAANAPRPFDAPNAAPFTANTPQASIDPVADLHEELQTMTDQADAPVPAPYNPIEAQQPEAEPANNPFAAPVPPVSMPVSMPESEATEAAVVVSEAEPVPEVTPAPSVPGFAPSITDKSLNDLGIVELVERFALALQAKADAKAEAEAAADAAPLVFQRSGAAPAAPFAPSEADDAGNALAQFFAPPANEQAPAPEPEPAPTVEAAPEPDYLQDEVATAAVSSAPAVPASMQPVDLDDYEDDDADETQSLSLSLSAAHQPFVQSSAPVADAAVAHDFTETGEPEAEEESAEYSSLLAMKSPFVSGQEFVRIEDEPEDQDGAVEPTVVFPGSERRATPATDGPSRDPFPEATAGVAPALRPFDAPGQARPAGLAKPTGPSSPDDTERALRDALEKLQRMSGAA